MFILQTFNVYYALIILFGLMNIKMKGKQILPSEEKIDQMTQDS